MHHSVGESLLEGLGKRYKAQAQAAKFYANTSAIEMGLLLVQAKAGVQHRTQSGALISEWIDQTGEIGRSIIPPALVEYVRQRGASDAAA